ncbi:MAG: hypothetical protein V7K27_03435 [Nostoc sp.]
MILIVITLTSLIFSLVQFSSRADFTAWLGTSDVLGITGLFAIASQPLGAIART